MTGSCPVSALVCQETARELERLRAGLEALAEKWDDPPSPWESPGYYSAYYDCADAVLDLLNPTEGGTDE